MANRRTWPSEKRQAFFGHVEDIEVEVGCEGPGLIEGPLGDPGAILPFKDRPDDDEDRRLGVGHRHLSSRPQVPADHNPGVLPIEVDVSLIEDELLSFERADVVIQAANPGYLGIVEHLPKLVEAVLVAAELTGKRVVFLEGVCTYGKNPGRPVREDDTPNPVSRKGRVKQACAESILSSRWQRAHTMVLRMPDYYGPTSQMAYLDTTFQAMLDKKFGFFIGDRRPKREYIYLPDAAERIVKLATDPSAYGQVWNLSGLRLSGKKIVKLCRKHLGYRTWVWSLGSWSINAIGWFAPFFRELSEMT